MWIYIQKAQTFFLGLVYSLIFNPRAERIKFKVKPVSLVNWVGQYFFLPWVHPHGILYVQEVVIHLYSKLLYKMGH